MLGVRIHRHDARAVRAAMAMLRDARLIAGPARDVRMEMYCALWGYIGGPLPHDTAVAVAHLAALGYLREQRRQAPCSDMTPLHEPKPRKPRTSWWGALIDNEA